MPNDVKVTKQHAMALCSAVLSIYDSADGEIGAIGERTLRTLIAFFCDHSPAEVIAATDRKANGIQSRTSQASRLSDTRAIFRAYQYAPDRLRFETLDTAPGRGWQFYLSKAREILEDQRADGKAAKLAKEAEKVAAVQAPNDAAKQAEIVAAYREQHAAYQRAEAEKADAAKYSAPEIAKRLVARMVKEYGELLPLDVIDALPAAFEAKQAEMEKAVEA